MALDKMVDSAKLDACLEAEADAIRAKTGGSADIPFDYANNKGFADAIAAIPSGGGSEITKDEWTLTSDLNTSTQAFYYGQNYIDCSFVGVQILHIDGNTATSNVAKGAYIDTHYNNLQNYVFVRGAGAMIMSSGQEFNISAGSTITRYKIPSDAFPT